jgi:hypothetical protein
LPTAVHRLVALDQYHRPVIRRLTPTQVEALTRVARTPHTFDEPVSAQLAVRALARGAKATSELARIARDEKASVTARVTAARELGLLATPDAEKALRRSVHDPHPRVQQAVFWALGAQGGPSTLRLLTETPEPRDTAARRQLLFARTLIAHRHGLDTAHLPPIESEMRRPEQVGDQAKPTISLQAAAATAKDRKRLSGSTYGIALAQRALAVVCGKTWTVFFNRETDHARMAERLDERPWVLGLVAGWHGGRKLAIVKHLILTTPHASGINVDIVRRDGERIYTGNASVDGNVATLTIADFDRPATMPTFISIRVSSRGLTVERAAVSSKRVGVRPTTAIPQLL